MTRVVHVFENQNLTKQQNCLTLVYSYHITVVVHKDHPNHLLPNVFFIHDVQLNESYTRLKNVAIFQNLNVMQHI